MKYLLFPFLIFILVSIACASGGPTPTPTTPQEIAWDLCTTYIEQSIGAQPSEAEKFDPYKVGFFDNDNVYRVDILYPGLHTTYECRVKHELAGNYVVLNVTLP